MHQGPTICLSLLLPAVTRTQYFLYERKVFGWELQQYTYWNLCDTIIKAFGKIGDNEFAPEIISGHHPFSYIITLLLTHAQMSGNSQPRHLTCCGSSLSQHDPFRRNVETA